MKPKTLRYRLRVLEKQPASTEYSQYSLDDLFIVNDLNEREEQTYKALR
jgi:hypothetical protein